MDILNKDVRRVFLRYTLTSVLGMMMMSFYILVDTMFIGRILGEEALAALNLAIPFYNLLIATGLLFGVGGAALHSIHVGAGRRREAGKYFSMALVGGIVLGTLYTLLGLFLREPLARFAGATPETAPFLVPYLGIVLSFGFFYVLVNLLTVFIRNDEAPKYAMFVTAAGGLLNVGLDYLMIVRWSMGMEGAALATGLSTVFSFLLILGYFLFQESGLRFAWRGMEGQDFGALLRVGFPSFVVEGSTGLVIFVFNAVLLRTLGVVGVTVYGIISNISLIAIAIFAGVSQGMQPVVSVAHGAGAVDRLKKVRKYGLLTVSLLGGALGLAGILSPEFFIHLFLQPEAKTLQVAQVALPLYFSGFLFVGWNIILTGYYQAVERTMLSTWISLLRGVFLVLLFLLVLPQVLGPLGIWLAVPLAEAGTLLSLLLRQRFRGLKSRVLRRAP